MVPAGLLLAAGGVLAAPVAEAATGGCAGQRTTTVAFATGEIRVYRTRTSVCAVTVPTRAGTRQEMAVSVQPRGGAPVRDAGRFTRFAGPVTVPAVSRCVYVKGDVGSGSGDSGWILC
ncbi:hypothetical protein [Streptomyces sp. G-G2]|uniref:hypothetical protein n=1 Tax=Streptomyces sp. G-G2 TaxID=3046201 RepID=UPI0024B95070|nr:hypothetical protein [Streptomyces sp. G-G2]MDJ0379734.1 hypothetical protein [Streptomyces sp. G-G2]